MNKALFRRATEATALPKASLALLYSVTRPTIYAWLADGEPKNAALSAYADKVSAALVLAVERRILPFPASMSAKQRAEHVQRMHTALTKNH